MKRLLICASLAVLMGCGAEDPEPSAAKNPTAEATELTTPATGKAFAALVVEHVGEEPYSARPSTATEFGDTFVGAEVQFLDPATVDDPMEGDGVEISAGAVEGAPDWLDDEVCDGTEDGCATSLQDDGSTLIYTWEEVAPEEDPGYIWVLVQRADETVAVLQAGPNVTSDPQDMDLQVSVDDMIAIANDPRLSLTTSKELVEAEVPNWEAG